MIDYYLKTYNCKPLCNGRHHIVTLDILKAPQINNNMIFFKSSLLFYMRDLQPFTLSLKFWVFYVN